MIGDGKLDILLGKLDPVKCTRTGWEAKCPAHEDKRASLSIKLGDDGKVLLHCFAGCDPEDVLKAVGLSWSDLYESRPKTAFRGPRRPGHQVADPLKWLAEYAGVPEDFIRSLPLEVRGKNVAFTFEKSAAVKCREAGCKDFTWEATSAASPPLWPMPECKLPREIYLAEGESDCIVLRHCGIPAFAVTKGAASCPSFEQLAALKSRGVEKLIVVYDADEPGRRGTKKLCETASIAGLDSVRIDLASAGIVDPLLGQKDLRDAWLTVRDAGAFRDRLRYATTLDQEERPKASNLIMDAADLAATEHPAELPSLLLLESKGYIIEGWSHIVSGYPKAGKTELLFACAKRWVASGIPVLWLSEESQAVWRHRLGRGLDISRGLGLCFALGMAKDDLLSIAQASDAHVVIVDTVRSLMGISDENDNSQVAATLGKWEHGLAERTRIYVHHQRKMSGDNGEAIAGGGAFLGCVDRSLELKREANCSNRRVLEVRSRIVQPPNLLYELSDVGLRAIGDADAVSLTAVQERVMVSLDGEWLSTGEVERGIGDPKPSRPQLLAALSNLRNREVIERRPLEDRQGATYRWRRSHTATETLPLT